MFDTKSLNMKHKLLFIAAAVAMLLSACSKPEAEPQVIEKLNISPSKVYSPSAGGDFDIKVLSNTDWSVKSDKQWAVPSVSNGSKDGSFTIKVAANTASADDDAVVTVSTQNLSLTIDVSRKGKTE